MKDNSINAIHKFLIFSLLLLLIFSCNEDTIDFQETGAITGTVISEETGNALANVEISTNPSSSTVFTDSLGIFNLQSIIADSYAVQAEFDGFETGFGAVTVNPDQTANIAFSLDPIDVENIAPDSPTLVFPEDGANDIDVQVELAWFSMDPEEDEITYNITLRNGNTNEIINQEVVADTTFVVTDLDLSTNYFWQVSATDGNSDPVTSDLSQFSTLDSPANPFIFVRQIEGNNVIFSGNRTDSIEDVNIDVLQISEETNNSFRPRRNNDVNRIAFLRTVGGNTQLFTMDLAGEDVRQITGNIPVVGFRQEELSFAWFNNGQSLLYPNFDELYSINMDGSGNNVVYQTPDGSLISEVDVSDFDNDLILIKTNDLDGYNVRIVLVRLSTGLEEAVILEGELGAVTGINISANGDNVLYARDVSGSENEDYRIFSARLFIYDVNDGITTQVITDVESGQNDLNARFSPSEGEIIFTRRMNFSGSTPNIITRAFDAGATEMEIFTNSFMPDWE